MTIDPAPAAPRSEPSTKIRLAFAPHSGPLSALR
ncbi:MAG: hypothetical protein QG573_1700 [Acidobacteriota bacterium]|nr:hypothetical protein [Acidobacteriota bacterium]